MIQPAQLLYRRDSFCSNRHAHRAKIFVDKIFVINLHLTKITKCIDLENLELYGSTSTVSALPDSGADVSVAGLAVLESLNEHPDNLLPSKVVPRAVNGTTMSPIEKLPATVSLNTAQYVDEFHINFTHR